jgi:hypothetical protein
MSQKNALPNGPQFQHIFCQSTATGKPVPELLKMVHRGGSSFKFAWAFDAHKYHNWQMASDDDLKTWATKFRESALQSGSEVDYFAFNEMPSNGGNSAEVRSRVTKLLRYLSEAGGGPKLRGLFYFVEPNTDPKNWSGDTTEFWETLNETCDQVVAEHYHTDDFVFSRTLQELTDHLFALPRWMIDSKSSAQQNIARKKFSVLHSSYWGPGQQPWDAIYQDVMWRDMHLKSGSYKSPRVSGWEGLLHQDHEAGDLDKFFHRCIAATRNDPLGANRIGFGPLGVNKPLDFPMLPLLAKNLGKDAADWSKAHGIQM